MPEIDTEASRAWHRRLREVLNRDWNPIGVARKVEDEYDGYAAKIAVMLRENASDEELLAYLEWAEFEHMGLGRCDQNRNLEVIAKLRNLGPQP
jgi:hypothetical protein